MLIQLHVEADESGIAWWADSPDAPGFSAAADALHQLVVLVRESAEEEGWPALEFAFPSPGWLTC